MSKSIAEVLSEAADLIAGPGKWTQGQYARRRDGRPVAPKDPRAVCWCLDGALERVKGTSFTLRERDFLHGVIGRSPIPWNDAPDRTQEEVVAKLREAAAVARERGR